MGKMNRWDIEDYRWQMEAVGNLYEAARDIVIHMEKYLSIDLTGYGRNYDSGGVIADAARRFKENTIRLNNLHETMKLYEQEYTSMVEQGQNTMENVTVENVVYGSFGSMLAGGTALTGLCTGSVAWQFFQSGFDFNTHFNDVQAFMDDNPNYNFFEGAQALSEMASWDSHTVDLLISNLTGESTDFAEELEMSALLAALESVPGYTPADTEKMDWGQLGDKLGVPGLGKKMEKVIKWISGLEGSLDYNAMSEELTDLMLGADMEEVKEIWESFMRAEKLGELMGKLTKFGFSVGKAAETVFEILYHFTANHVSQTEYLDSIDEAMAMAGYSEVGGLRGMLRDIRESFVSGEKYVLDMAAGKIEEILEGKLGAAVTEGANVAGQILIDAVCENIPNVLQSADSVTPLQYANVVIDGVGLAVDLAGEEQIKAIETLQGLQIYTPTLITSFEKNMALIEAGVADAEDIANADNLFQLIRSAKIEEYEAMLSLQSQGEVALELREKLALLERMGSLEDFMTIPASHLPK